MSPNLTLIDFLGQPAALRAVPLLAV
jgi:hypothetical protein